MAKFKVLIEATLPDFSKYQKWVKLEATDKKDAEKKAISAGNALFNRIARKTSKGKPDIDIISVFSGFIDSKKTQDKSPLSFMDSVVRAFRDEKRS